MRVRLENIHKSFGAVEVVKGLSLEVEDGEFLVLLGASGSGKTTALRMIAGLEIGDLRPRPDRRARRHRRAAEISRHRDGVPVLRALPAQDRVRQHRLSAHGAEAPQGRDRGDA